MINPFATNEPAPQLPNLIGFQLFSELYSAMQFACEWDLPPSTHVTVHWGKLGCQTVDTVADGFNSFAKCVRDWFRQRRIPLAYLFSHENSSKAGLHTHLAIHVPSDHRKEFLAYLRKWVVNRHGQEVPTAIRVRGTSNYNPISIWHIFSYLVKGYDRQVTLRSPANDTFGQGLMLGDIIAAAWQNPGHVPLAKRAGVSPAISAKQRALGYPMGCEELAAPSPLPPSELDLFGKGAGAGHIDFGDTYIGGTGVERCSENPKLLRKPATPFRSSVEDGIFDVRQLYPAAFYSWVTRLCP